MKLARKVVAVFAIFGLIVGIGACKLVGAERAAACLDRAGYRLCRWAGFP